MAFLPDRYSRNFLNLPTQDQVDFRAACFCHKQIVDIGFVCSVCLSSKKKKSYNLHYSYHLNPFFSLL